MIVLAVVIIVFANDVGVRVGICVRDSILITIRFVFAMVVVMMMVVMVMMMMMSMRVCLVTLMVMMLTTAGQICVHFVDVRIHSG